MKWFKHDSSACFDAKIEHLMDRYGLEGYGLYFYLLEAIARNVEIHNLSFELEHDSKIIARRLYMNQQAIEEMMGYMVELGLFELQEAGVITCLKLSTRTDEYTQKLIKKQSHIPCPDNVPTKSVLKEEKRTDKNRIDKKREEKPKASSRFSPPQLQDVTEYMISKNGDQQDAEAFIDFYASKNWMVGKNKMSLWKNAASGWIRRKTQYENSRGTSTAGSEESALDNIINFSG